MKVFISSTYKDLIEHRQAVLTPLSCRRGAGGEAQ
jgi:hypothetical protein